MSRVTFNNKYSPFFDALKENVEEYFQSNKIKSTGNFSLYSKTIILFTLAVSLYIMLVFFTPGYLLSVLLCSSLGFILATIGFNVMHDGAHGSYSSNRKLNDMMADTLNIMGGSSYIWKIKHNLIHHSFTNIEGIDDDIDNHPWFCLNNKQKKYSFHKFQHLYWVLLYGISYAGWVFFLDFKKYFSGMVGETKMRKMETYDHVKFWISKVIYVTLFLVLPIFYTGFVPTLIGYFIVAFVCGVTISTVFQLAHIVEGLDFPEPDGKTNKIENEWAVHQIATTANFATKSKVVSWLVGGLNFQIEHHLFPKVSHIHYPAISKIVRETCEEFNLKYLEYPTLYSAIRSHVEYLKVMGR